MSTLNIKDSEVRALAHELAQCTGQSMTAAVKEALREKLARERAVRVDRGRRVERVLARTRELAKLPILDTRSEDEILGYDENGIPR